MGLNWENRRDIVLYRIVQTGIFSKEKGRFFNNLFHMRLTGDYSDRFDLTLEEVQSKVMPTEKFVTEVVSFAKQKIGLDS